MPGWSFVTDSPMLDFDRPLGYILVMESSESRDMDWVVFQLSFISFQLFLLLKDISSLLISLRVYEGLELG